MWSLFSSKQPRVQKPAFVLKQNLLQVERKALLELELKSKELLLCISGYLKNSSSENDSPQCKIDTLQQNIQNLKVAIDSDLWDFTHTSQNRHQQKKDRQEFFKVTLRQYQKKKTDLNKHCQLIESKVQKLEDAGCKTYVLEPELNSVLIGMNDAYVKEYFRKKQQETIFLENYISSRQKRVTKKSISQQCDSPKNSLSKIKDKNQPSELAAYLYDIFVSEEIKEQFINSQIDEQKRKFARNAKKANALRKGLKKLTNINKNFDGSTKQFLQKSQSQSEGKQTPVRSLSGFFNTRTNSQALIDLKKNSGVMGQKSVDTSSNKQNQVERLSKVDLKLNKFNSGKSRLGLFSTMQEEKLDASLGIESSYGRPGLTNQFQEFEGASSIVAKDLAPENLNSERLSCEEEAVSQQFIQGCESILSSQFIPEHI